MIEMLPTPRRGRDHEPPDTTGRETACDGAGACDGACTPAPSSLCGICRGVEASLTLTAEEPLAPSVRPWNAWASASDSTPAQVTAPATSQRFARSTRSSPASLASTPGWRSPDLPRSATRSSMMGNDCGHELEASAKETVRCRLGRGEIPLIRFTTRRRLQTLRARQP